MLFKGVSRILDLWVPVSVIGSGVTATVFRANHRMTGEEAAIKHILNPDSPSRCSPPRNTPEGEVNLHCFLASQAEAKILMRFRGGTNIIQFNGEPEFLVRSLMSNRREQVMLCAVIICMPLYQNHQAWMKEISGSVKKRLLVGIDRALATSGTSIDFCGNVDCMPPALQQFRDSRRRRSAHRSDIYSLGVALYSLFNTSVPGSCVTRERPSRPPARQSEIISKGCACSANARYQSAQDRLTDLPDYWEHGSTNARQANQPPRDDRRLLTGLLIVTVAIFALSLGCVVLALSEPGKGGGAGTGGCNGTVLRQMRSSHRAETGAFYL